MRWARSKDWRQICAKAEGARESIGPLPRGGNSALNQSWHFRNPKRTSKFPTKDWLSFFERMCSAVCVLAALFAEHEAAQLGTHRVHFERISAAVRRK